MNKTAPQSRQIGYYDTTQAKEYRRKLRLRGLKYLGYLIGGGILAVIAVAVVIFLVETFRFFLEAVRLTW